MLWWAESQAVRIAGQRVDETLVGLAEAGAPGAIHQVIEGLVLWALMETL
jgi:hypothetical protein